MAPDGFISSVYCFMSNTCDALQIWNLSTYEEKNSFSAHVKQRSFLLGGDQTGVTEVSVDAVFCRHACCP